MEHQKQTVEFDPSTLAEPPMVQKGYELIIEIPRGSGKAPKGWKETNDERGLTWTKKEVAGGLLMLSVRTINYREFRELHDKFVHRMPWSGEITQWWHRAYTTIELIRHLNDDANEQQERERPEISTPAARVRGITFEEEQLSQFREMRTQARIVAQEERARALAEAPKSPALIATSSNLDPDLAVQNARFEAEDRQRVEVEEREIDPVALLRSNPVVRIEAREDVALRRDLEEDRQRLALASDVYGDLLYLFTDRVDLTLETIIKETQFQEDLIRPVLAQLESEGKITVDVAGFHATDLCLEENRDE